MGMVTMMGISMGMGMGIIGGLGIGIGMGGGEKVYLEARHEVHEAYPTFQKSVDLLNYDMKMGVT